MSESAFEKLFDRFGKRAYLHKITDSKEVNGKRKAFNKDFVRTKAQPCDYIVTLNGDTFWAEVKSSENDTSFPFSNIRTKQLAHARMILAAGGKYYFFILRTKTSEWFKVPADVITYRMDHEGKKSMKWEELTFWSFGV